MTQPVGAFVRLRALLRDVSAPTRLKPICLHLGESRLVAPAAQLEHLAIVNEWTRYPPPGGTTELRAAYMHWLERRFGARQILRDRTVAVEPTPGTKQAVAVAIALAVTRARGVDSPAVVMPNPFYPAYRAGADAVGAQAVHYSLADGRDAAAMSTVVRAVRGRVAALVVCHPGSPRGEVLAAETLREAGKIAAAADAVLIVDECYIDLSIGPQPPGYLSVVKTDPADAGSFLVLHTLSKRSGAPGLRSGFVAGDPWSVASYADYNRACGVSNPGPVCAAATALWSDDVHIAHMQSALTTNWDLADAILGDIPGYRRAEAGFFLWLPVVDDEATARRLWCHHGLLVMPGRYLSTAGSDGVDPGVGYVRIALVHDQELMREALTRLRDAMAQALGGRPCPAGRVGYDITTYGDRGHHKLLSPHDRRA